jgi:hypothetical protein
LTEDEFKGFRSGICRSATFLKAKSYKKITLCALRYALCEGFFVGRTILPFSRVLEQEVQEWKKFRRGLRKEDQQFLDRLFEEARLHVQAGVYASRPWPFETIMVSILLEHEKALVDLRSKIKILEEQKKS